VGPAAAVSILKYWPEGRWDDAPSAVAVEEKVSVGGSLGFSEAGVGLSVSPGYERTSAFTRLARRNIRGASFGAPVRNQVRWALEESSVQKEGIWENFRLAILARHEGSFSVEMEIKAKVGFSTHPRKLLWPLRGKSGVRVLDPGTPIGEAGSSLELNVDLDKINLAELTSFPGLKAAESMPPSN
jgi:hypothetical protein